MADSFIGITEPAIPNKKLDSESLAVGGNTVERERVQIVGTAATDIAPVTAADGLSVKVTNTVPVSGTVSVTEPVTVDATDLDTRNLVFATDKVDVSGSTGVGVTGTFFQATQPISAVSLPLPTGAATLAAQTQPGVDIGDVTVNNAAGAAAVNIQDGGNSITVDGTVTVVGPEAHDAAVSSNPIVIAGRASLAIPTAVSADDDVSRIWVDKRGQVRILPGTEFDAMYFYITTSLAHVAAAATPFWDMFNADASVIVRVLLIWHIINLETTQTGMGFEWNIRRTTTVGTGGSVLTAWLADTTDTALDADITSRAKPTGGATPGTQLVQYYNNSEESIGAQQIYPNLVPPILLPPFGRKGIVLRQNQGLLITQNTNSSAGNSAFLIGFTVDGV